MGQITVHLSSKRRKSEKRWQKKISSWRGCTLPQSYAEQQPEHFLVRTVTEEAEPGQQLQSKQLRRQDWLSAAAASESWVIVSDSDTAASVSAWFSSHV